MHRPVLLAATLSLALAAPASALPALSDYEIGLLSGVNSLGSPVLDTPMAILSNTAFTALAPVALGAAADPNSVSAPLVILSAEALAYGASAAIKPLFRRPRPYESYADIKTPDGKMTDDPYSFPSGHSTVAFAGATVLADMHPSFAIPAYGLAALIAYSRMYNGVHYPSDVLTGAALGFGVGKLTRWGFDQLSGRNGFPRLQFSSGFGPGEAFMLGTGGQF